MDVIKVGLVEDDPEIVFLVQRQIKTRTEFCLVGVWSSGEQALAATNVEHPDVLLLDIGLPGKTGIALLPQFRAKFPATDIVMLTGSNASEDIFNSLRNGAVGYLSKSYQAEELYDALRIARRGGAPMSPAIARKVVDSFRGPSALDYQFTAREREILKLLCEGLSYKQIAARQFVETNTVHFHIKNIYRKLHVNSKGEAISKAIHEGLA